jgi:putative addiction module component (TIGR02574 family)
MNTKQLIDEAASLPVEERALIANSLLRTLNRPDPEIDEKWSAVAKRRLAELKNGAVKGVPGDDVFRRIWGRLENTA